MWWTQATNTPSKPRRLSKFQPTQEMCLNGVCVCVSTLFPLFPLVVVRVSWKAPVPSSFFCPAVLSKLVSTFTRGGHAPGVLSFRSGPQMDRKIGLQCVTNCRRASCHVVPGGGLSGGCTAINLGDSEFVSGKWVGPSRCERHSPFPRFAVSETLWFSILAHPWRSPPKHVIRLRPRTASHEQEMSRAFALLLGAW